MGTVPSYVQSAQDPCIGFQYTISNKGGGHCSWFSRLISIVPPILADDYGTREVGARRNSSGESRIESLSRRWLKHQAGQKRGFF